MPCLISPNSLQTICLNSIVDNLETFWLPRFLSEVFPDSRNRTPLYIIGPFDCLSSNSAQSLFNKALKQGKNSFRTLLLLLNYKVVEVNLSRARYLTSVKVWELLNSRCLYIQKLNLSTCARVTSADLVTIIKQYGGKIRDLDLSLTRTDDDVTAAIGEQCKVLEKLNLDGCDRLTENGLVSLFRDGDDVPTSLCATLKDLDIHSFNKIEDSDQFIGLLLETWCQNLQYLSYSLLSAVLTEICDHTSVFQLKRIPPLSTDDSNPFGFSHFKHSLPKLTELMLIVGVREELLWEALSIWGSKLESLHVKAAFPLTWLRAVATMAPQIKHLTLSMSSLSYQGDADLIVLNIPEFEQLETLRASFISHRIIPITVFSLCLKYLQNIVAGSYHTLREITINSYPHVSINTFVLWCCHNNGFSNVELLNLEDCSVDICTIWEIVYQTDGNAIKKLVLNNCQSISLAEIQIMRKHIKEKNLDLEIEFDL